MTWMRIKKAYWGHGLLPLMSAILVVGLFQLSLVPQASGEEAPGYLWGGRWDLSTWGFTSQGLVVWVIANDNLRLDVFDSPGSTAISSSDLGLVWGEEGRGWTVVTNQLGKGTFNQWGEGWKPLDPKLGFYLFQLVQRIEDFYKAAGMFSGQQTEKVYILDSLSQPGHRYSAAQQNLIQRGLGQGGTGEILHMKTLREKSGTASSTLALASTRRPGAVHFVPTWQGRELAIIPFEVFAPVWTLGELLDFPVN